VTEADWLTSDDPAAMLRSLNARLRAAQRRGGSPDFECLRRFACACCRRVWSLLDADHRRSVELIEGYTRAPVAGGLLAARRARAAAGSRASNEYHRISTASPDDRPARLLAWARNVAASAVWQAADKNPATAANCHAEAAQAAHSVLLAEGAVAGGPDPGFIGYQPPAGGELAAQAALLREVVGNPFGGRVSAGVSRARRTGRCT
jgi:hypothetical protein